MHLNWFSPLPPARTDVADYTARLAPALAERFELTFWTDHAAWDNKIEKFGIVRTYQARDVSPSDLAGAELNIFNIGNDRAFHRNIFQLARAHPGIVILHDLFLPNLARRFALHAPRKLLFNSASGFIVHSRQAFETLRAETNLPVRLLALPFAASPQKTASQDRDSASSPKRLIIFGFLGANRRLENILRALQSYPRKNELRLDIYGQISKPRALSRLIANLHLSDGVKFHGFVPTEELEAALARADLAINLRHPTMGEASGSQLRIWDHALPSLVSATGWYLDLAPDTVGYVDPNFETRDLHAHFDRLLDAPEIFRGMGERGRAALIANHQPRDYVDALVEFVGQLETSRAQESRDIESATS